METGSLLNPELYSPTDGVTAGAACTLNGGRCTCGYVFFPMQRFGCEQCGRTGDHLQPMALRGRGTLLASAVVHLHKDAKRRTPFIIGSIRLAEGPVVRTLLARGVDATSLSPGSDMEAVLEPVDNPSDGGSLYDLRFALAEEVNRA